METSVYFVRHAQPDFRIKDDLIRPLTEKGMEDRKKVTSILRNKNVSAIYSSPYLRAIDTVKDFADNIGLEIKTDVNLCERRFGEGIEDYKLYFKRQWDDFEFKLPQGESLREVQQRNITALFNILKTDLGKNIAVGTHGTALSTIINYFNPDFGHDQFMSIIDKMPHIICLKFKELEFVEVEEIDV